MTMPPSPLSRRWVLAALMAGAASPALAGPLARSLRPVPRPERQRQAAEAEALIRRARLDGKLAYAVADAATGEMLDLRNPVLGLPPASVAKSVTALYALETLGADHRFATQVLATGPVVDGRLLGDLVLAGGGDPTLDTDMLGDLAARLGATGLREVTGRFLFHAGDLPRLPAIDPAQPPHVGYNPAVSGLNLNFNRVHFEWKREGAGYDVTLDARARRFAPQVNVARMQVVDRPGPVYTYSSKGGVDEWTVAQGALGNGGARWLPVRQPALYCAEVFHTLARSAGIALPRPQEAAAPVTGTVLARHLSEPLTDILRDMMKFSTNMTAETVGLAATLARGGHPLTLTDSGQAMAAWLAARSGARKARFVDHSGLGDASRLTAVEMARMLAAVAPDARLKGLMKEVYLRDAKGRPLYDHPVSIRAKTGTLNFVSGLAGYVTFPSGRELAFAIFAADTERRAHLGPQELENPAGGKSWITRARRLQTDLLESWITSFG
ncbi:D-alanyl-D-alanine carboxypeptidase/D-alanyl-D-alanine endopeptidase [Rhodovulum euryhalinum]|uniref:D-alanyl-D-alanine carboxypeptidase/D-alanyl-D-alanine-endopeptidase (Penicillin-binding protein 4) n=1 Tax=Rhodovulum euryhalinum TaxID=35805 RepID=A0A4R2KC99_9RHOB|nr:D-alanyl-D-alanine carboxypeptidase/D-alanyl-D-alanine-endopeptidase [Rhodovulum euryhalinum]TCO71113.1 D-alanyl-D-alanine carboxypeptidase/D-alanyl-D-alanine-endopeptidase (penicillin-binding protein 4) [Rhodovulum euryhalinum]